MDLKLDRHSKVPLYLQLVRQLRIDIASGRLGSDYQLPPERELAENLGVNRSTIVQVYEQLRQEGLIVSHVGRGTFVSDGPRRTPDAREETLPATQLQNRQSGTPRGNCCSAIMRIASPTMTLPRRMRRKAAQFPSTSPRGRPIHATHQANCYAR